eukprot:13370967-Alexandrium_andersonii.AAC.1
MCIRDRRIAIRLGSLDRAIQFAAESLGSRVAVRRLTRGRNRGHFWTFVRHMCSKQRWTHLLECALDQ